MKKNIKILICFFIFFSFSMWFSLSSAKYIMEDITKVAILNIDRSNPQIKLVDITTCNLDSSHENNLITLHFKVIEKHIAKNNLSSDYIKILADNKIITPEYKDFFATYKGSNEIVYELSFTSAIKLDSLTVEIPKGLILDTSGLTNDKITFPLKPIS